MIYLMTRRLITHHIDVGRGDKLFLTESSRHQEHQDLWKVTSDNNCMQDCLPFIRPMIFFSYLTNFNSFPLKIVFRKLLDKVRTGQKWPFGKGSVDGFSYFSLISIILFYNQYHPW